MQLLVNPPWLGILWILFVAQWHSAVSYPYPPGHVSTFSQPTGNDPDFPGFKGNIENITSCSYLIPMDLYYQGCGNESDPEVGIINSACDKCTPYTLERDQVNINGNNIENCLTNNTDFNLFAYGLVNYLLWHDIPVKWIIKTNKTDNGYDLENIATALIYPTRILNRTRSASEAVRESAVARSFKGGPFLVETLYTSFADTHISYYTLNTGEVRVYATKDFILADVRYTLLSRPYVAVLASSGQQFILEATLLSAGFERNKHFEVMTKDDAKKKLGEGVCITIAMEPHFHSSSDHDLNAYFTNNSAAFVTAARTFLNYGSNLYAMCGGINTYEQCDNEDGTHCYNCEEYTPNPPPKLRWQQTCAYCTNGTVGVNTTSPCYGPWDRVAPNCNGGNNVAILSFGESRGGPMMAANTGVPHARSFPLPKGYCPDGFFVSEADSDPKHGGFFTPAHRTAPAVANIPNNYTFFVNMNPDIPFNQYDGLWEYEPDSSVRFMSLWHQSDVVDPTTTTNLRTANWAHWTLAEINQERDNKTRAGYPYGVYYTAHAKLPQFHGGKGGNIFYVAGHYYANRWTDANAGYLLPVTPDVETDFPGAACVDAGPTNITINGTWMSGPATRDGGGCFNRPGRRMMMNAVLTPSNLTCNAKISICGASGVCSIQENSITLDPCKAYGICVSSSFKRAILVENNSTSNSTCAPRLRCTCDLFIDCCAVCGGNNATCTRSPPSSGGGGGGGKPTTINGQNVTAFTGKLPVVPLPPVDTGGFKSPPLNRRDIVAFLSSSNYDDSIWVPVLGTTIPKISSYSLDGPVTLVLTSAPSNVTAFLEAIKSVILALGNVDPSRVHLTYNPVTRTITIVVDGFTAPSPTPVPTPVSTPTVINITEPVFQEKESGGNLLPSGACRFYTFTAGATTYKVQIFAAIQSKYPSQVLRVALQKNAVPDLTHYDCLTPEITDNNEYTLTWVATSSTSGNFLGSSASLSSQPTCKENSALAGVWYASVCATNSKLVLSYEVSLLQVPVTPPVAPQKSDASSLSFNFLLLLLFCYLLVQQQYR